jgi:two-component system, OmpR family, response regulator RpaA
MRDFKDVLTTGQVAKICNVAPRTVSKWFDNGQLRGYRIPGSKDRRIPLSHLVSFMRTYGIPLNDLELGATRLLVLDSDLAANGVLFDALIAEGGIEVSCVKTAFEAGLSVENVKPAVMLVDVSLPDVDPEQLCKDLRSSDALSGLKLIATSGSMTEGQRQSLLQTGFNACLPKPFDSAQLRDVINDICSL